MSRERVIVITQPPPSLAIVSSIHGAPDETPLPSPTPAEHSALGVDVEVGSGLTDPQRAQVEAILLAAAEDIHAVVSQ